MFCLHGTYSHLWSEEITRTGRICSVVTKAASGSTVRTKSAHMIKARYLKGVVDESTTFKPVFLISPHQHIWFCFSDPCLIYFLMKEESSSLFKQYTCKLRPNTSYTFLYFSVNIAKDEHWFRVKEYYCQRLESTQEKKAFTI